MSDLFHEKVPTDYVRLVFEAMNAANWHIYQVLTKPHIWLGVSVENRKHGLPRIDELRRSRAAVRFLSIEPLLEDLGEVDLTGIDWVIVGGESGPGARPMKKAWVLSLRDQCEAAGVKFFFKQWGGLRKKIAGRDLEGRTYDEIPARTLSTAPPKRERGRRVDALTRLAAGL